MLRAKSIERRACRIIRQGGPGAVSQVMTAMDSARLRSSPFVAALAVALGGAATILGAYFFQYVLGLPPCPLCLDQRVPYYIAIPLGLALAVWIWRGAPVWVVRAGLAALVVVMLVGAGLGLYHAGVEWRWWPGPTDCSGPVGAGLGSAADLMSRIEVARVVRCDEAAWRFLGLSLAGYNVLIALVLAAVAGWGLAASRRAG